MLDLGFLNAGDTPIYSLSVSAGAAGYELEAHARIGDPNKLNSQFGSTGQLICDGAGGGGGPPPPVEGATAMAGPVFPLQRGQKTRHWEFAALLFAAGRGARQLVRTPHRESVHDGMFMRSSTLSGTGIPFRAAPGRRST